MAGSISEKPASRTLRCETDGALAATHWECDHETRTRCFLAVAAGAHARGLQRSGAAADRHRLPRGSTARSNRAADRGTEAADIQGARRAERQAAGAVRGQGAREARRTS